jgi:hypothetical protein
MSSNGIHTEPDFFDPEDDGIHEYFDSDIRRITKAEWFAAQYAKFSPEANPYIEPQDRHELPFPVDFGGYEAAINERASVLDELDGIVIGIADTVAKNEGATEITAEHLQLARQYWVYFIGLAIGGSVRDDTAWQFEDLFRAILCRLKPTS